MELGATAKGETQIKSGQGLRGHRTGGRKQALATFHWLEDTIPSQQEEAKERP